MKGCGFVLVEVDDNEDASYTNQCRLVGMPCSQQVCKQHTTLPWQQSHMLLARGGWWQQSVGCNSCCCQLLKQALGAAVRCSSWLCAAVAAISCSSWLQPSVVAAVVAGAVSYCSSQLVCSGWWQQSVVGAVGCSSEGGSCQARCMKQ